MVLTLVGHLALLDADLGGTGDRLLFVSISRKNLSYCDRAGVSELAVVPVWELDEHRLGEELVTWFAKDRMIAAAMTEKLAPEKRHAFVHQGQTVYEWDQTLDEVNMYIALPPKIPSRMLYCTIKSQHLELGIKGNPAYLNHDLAGPVKLDQSFWTIEDGIMHVTLQKREKGQPWPSAISGHGQLDAYSSDQEQRRLMLERFQEEHPGFDFSRAEFTGSCPNPKDFLGGIKQ